VKRGRCAIVIIALYLIRIVPVFVAWWASHRTAHAFGVAAHVMVLLCATGLVRAQVLFGIPAQNILRWTYIIITGCLVITAFRSVYISTYPVFTKGRIDLGNILLWTLVRVAVTLRDTADVVVGLLA